MLMKKKLRIKYEKNTTWLRVGKATLIYFYSLQIHQHYFLEIKIYIFFFTQILFIFHSPTLREFHEYF